MEGINDEIECKIEDHARAALRRRANGL